MKKKTFFIINKFPCNTAQDLSYVMFYFYMQYNLILASSIVIVVSASSVVITYFQ